MNNDENVYHLASKNVGPMNAVCSDEALEATRAQVTVEGPYFALSFPFDSAVKDEIKDLDPAVHFNPYSQTWMVPVKNIDAAKSILLGGIGTDGTLVDVVNVRLRFVTETPIETTSNLVFCGQQLVRLNGHYRARLARGVELTTGSACSRRISVGAWRVGLEPGKNCGCVEILIKNVARARALAMQEASSKRPFPTEFSQVTQITCDLG